jgi:hypothetical protein
MGVLPFKQIRAAATNALRVPLLAGTGVRPVLVQKKKSGSKAALPKETAGSEGLLARCRHG